jgi:hypothetical protein
MVIPQLDIALEDPYPPTLTTTPTGSLLADGPVANFRDIAFQATDRGSGVQRAVLEVDGRAVVDQLVDPNGGACVPPYDHVVPCKLAVAGTVGFDTTTVADGPHTGRLLIYDATGGNSTAFGPFHFVTSNRTVGAVCATGAKPPLRFSFKPGVVSFGRQGLLTAQLNQSVGPVEVAVLEGATALRKLATLKPDGQGRLFYRLGAGASRSIRLGLRPAGASSQRYACSTPKTLAVRAGVTLRLSDRRLRNGDRLQLGGRVLGGAAAAQKDVVVQARALHGRSWSTVRVVRADNRGRYRLRYRFRRTFWPVTYQFRAEVRPDRTFPYALGHSRIRAVKVVP